MKDCKTCAELVESLKVAAALIKQAKAQITELRIDLNFMKYDNRNLQAQLIKQSNRLSNRDAQVATAQSLLSQQQRRERLMQIQPNKGITEKGEIQADMIASAIEQALAAPPRPLSKRSKRLGSEG
jgi:hypothetical protein